jgi:guanylate kinase
MTKRRTEQPKIVAMIGASGSGKTTICNEIERVTNCDFRRVISHTTRKARPSEKDGISYYFTNKATFVNLILNDQI